MFENPYISKVKSHHKILIDLEKQVYINKWKWWDFFSNKNPISLEIWTWLWNYFSKNINENLSKNFLWMEIKYKRCFVSAEKTLGNIKNNDNLKDNTNLEKYNPNFAIIKDYWENIDKIFWDDEISETIIFFPDPWAKKKSQLKNRLVSVKFLEKLYKITKKWWKLFFKTDHISYFLYVLYLLENSPWKIKLKTFDYEKDLNYDTNSITEFEQIFRWKKLKIHYLELEK